MNKILKSGSINAFFAALYIVIVATFLFTLSNSSLPEQSVLMPIAMLMLFVFSAAMMSVIIFGKPATLYIDGKKKEALSLLAHTLTILMIIMIFVFILILFS